jgi:hypothetical protein
MKGLSSTFFFIILFISSNAQQFTGQWKGEFIDKSSAFGNFSGDKCDYVLELEVNNKSVSGSSYTYFTDNGKRFYTVCKVEGFIDLKKKYIEVKETERIKTNIPSNIRNCFQVHKLTYFKKGDIESLDGNWEPAPNQSSSCGFGNTTLTRRSLIESFPNAYSKANKLAKTNQNKDNKSIQNIQTKKTNPKIASEDNSNTTKNIETKTLENNQSGNSDNLEIPTNQKLVKRSSNLIKTIEVENKEIKVDLYDNGDIDGDSVSLFFNNKLILENKKLSDKPISLKLSINGNNNELVMFAENLGAFPPNTALMVVTDGSSRYEIRISSDLEKSGSIKFVNKHP